MKAEDIIYISLPIVTALILYGKDIVRDLLTALGIKKVLIVYFNDADYPSVQLLKGFFGISADVVKLSPYTQYLPSYAKNYRYVILLGGQNINPIYREFMELGYLPKLTQKGQYVIKQIGSFIFIAGYTAQDTYKAVQKFLSYLESKK